MRVAESSARHEIRVHEPRDRVVQLPRAPWLRLRFYGIRPPLRLSRPALPASARGRKGHRSPLLPPEEERTGRAARSLRAAPVNTVASLCPPQYTPQSSRFAAHPSANPTAVPSRSPASVGTGPGARPRLTSSTSIMRSGIVRGTPPGPQDQRAVAPLLEFTGDAGGSGDGPDGSHAHPLTGRGFGGPDLLRARVRGRRSEGDGGEHGPQCCGMAISHLAPHFTSLPGPPPDEDVDRVHEVRVPEGYHLRPVTHRLDRTELERTLEQPSTWRSCSSRSVASTSHSTST